MFIKKIVIALIFEIDNNNIHTKIILIDYNIMVLF